jgi:site-specific recombinase XerD
MLESFISYLINVEGKPLTTARMYEYDIKEMIKYFNEKKIKVKKATTKDLYNYMIYLSKKGLKAITRARQCSSIRVFYSYLGLKDNPAANLHKPKVEKKEVTYLSLSESIHLIKSTKEIQERNHKRNIAIITLFLNLGLRLSELVSIDIEDIKEDEIRIKGKGNKERILYLNPNCQKAILDYLEGRGKGALFLSEQGKRISRRTVQYIVAKEIKNAGLNSNISCHKLRHTCATNMYQAGTDIRLLQKILGHENISTTEIYIHVHDKQIKEAIERIGGIYEKL